MQSKKKSALFETSKATNICAVQMIEALPNQSNEELQNIHTTYQLNGKNYYSGHKLWRHSWRRKENSVTCWVPAWRKENLVTCWMGRIIVVVISCEDTLEGERKTRSLVGYQPGVGWSQIPGLGGGIFPWLCHDFGIRCYLRLVSLSCFCPWLKKSRRQWNRLTRRCVMQHKYLR